MASPNSSGTEPEGERFQRCHKGNASSERAASPSVASSVDGDEPGGVRLDQHSTTGSPEVTYTPPHVQQDLSVPHYVQERRNATESPSRVSGSRVRDDVFISPVKPQSERGGVRAVTFANIQRLDNAVAASGNKNNNKQIMELRPKTSNLSTRHQINGVDAQAVLPPTACIFVANLPEPKDDTTLEAGLSREFMQYGKAFIKIRRDGRHMPFAFVQYMTDQEAQTALQNAKGALICGRPCRTEMVKANRTFIIMRKYGPAISVPEAEAVLAAFGEIAKAEMLHPHLCDRQGYPPTVLVEFAHFDPSRDLQTAFRNDELYNVAAFDLKKNCAAIRQTTDEAYLAACERDRRSIYVGDLPPSTEKNSLAAFFAPAGEVLKVNTVIRPNGGVSGGVFTHGYRTLAFVEFTQPDMPERAIAMFNGAAYNGATIKVERKTIKDRGRDLTPRNSRMQLLHARRSNESNLGPSPGANRTPPHRGTTGGSQGGFRQQQQQSAQSQVQQTVVWGPCEQAPPAGPPSQLQTPSRALPSNGGYTQQHAPQGSATFNAPLTPGSQCFPQPPQQQTVQAPVLSHSQPQTPQTPGFPQQLPQQMPQGPVTGAMPPPPPGAVYPPNPSSIYGGVVPYNHIVPTPGPSPYHPPPMGQTGSYAFSPGVNAGAPPIPSPWSYYTGHWPSMATGYDPLQLYQPGMFPAHLAGTAAMQPPQQSPARPLLLGPGAPAGTPAPGAGPAATPTPTPTAEEHAAAGSTETPTRSTTKPAAVVAESPAPGAADAAREG